MTLGPALGQAKDPTIQSSRPDIGSICLLQIKQPKNYHMRTISWVKNAGQGIEQSYRLAYHHYHRAHAAGHLGAQYELGLLYLSGLGVTQNTAKATKLGTKSAMQGYGEAQYP